MSEPTSDAPAATVVQLRDHDETLGLSAYLQRLIALDSRAAVRLQATDRALGVWSGPPAQVVALRPVALAEPADIDVTVSAERLRERLVFSADTDSLSVDLPASVPGPSWVGLLPPRSGWERRGESTVAQVRSAVEAAVGLFRARSDGVEDRAQLESIAADVWGRACVAEVPVRAAHVAEKLGLLGDDGSAPVIAYAAGSWLRLQAPGGSVGLRREDSVGFSLFVD
jgi:hypothetical protein